MGNGCGQPVGNATAETFGRTTIGCTANCGSTTRSRATIRLGHDESANGAVATTASIGSIAIAATATIDGNGKLHSATGASAIAIHGTDSGIATSAVYAIWTAVCIVVCGIGFHPSAKRVDRLSANGGECIGCRGLATASILGANGTTIGESGVDGWWRTNLGAHVGSEPIDFGDVARCETRGEEAVDRRTIIPENSGGGTAIGG